MSQAKPTQQRGITYPRKEYKMHGIMDNDKGYVWGTTWHQLDQYVQLDRAITYEEAREVMDYPIEKRQLMRFDPVTELCYPAEAWEVVRTDDGTILAPMVGSRFVAETNLALLEMVHANFVDRVDGDNLQYESVGTLFGGSTAFVNLKLDEYQVKGDQSPTVSRLMYYNPIGKGSYTGCAHDVRVVCNNTLKMATLDGRKNESLFKLRHTASAGERIVEHLVDLAEIRMGVKLHQEQMAHLADISLKQADIDAFLDHLFPVDEEVMTKSQVTGRRNKQGAILNIFNGDQALKGKTRTSAYALLQATTDYVDHTITRQDNDIANTMWNGLVGDSTLLKKQALEYLTKVA